MSRNYTPTEKLFLAEWVPALEHRQKESQDRWVELYAEQTPEQVATRHVHDHTDVYQAFVKGLGIARPNEATVDRGLWSAFLSEEDSREVTLQSDDFDADVALYLKVSGDFADRAMKLAYARRLARALNEVALMNCVPAPADDKVMGYVEVMRSSYEKRPQIVRPAWMPDLVPGKYAIYMTPVEVSPVLSSDQNLLLAARLVLDWGKSIFLDPVNPNTGRRRKYALFDNVPTPDEFKQLAQAVTLAQGQPPNGVTQAP